MNASFLMRKQFVTRGFTLAELLIALGILGVIAAFTIPKIMLAQQQADYNAEAKEVASTISAIYLNDYMRNGGENWLTDINQVGTSYLNAYVPTQLNYVKRLTGGEAMTFSPGGSSTTYAGDHFCNASTGWAQCYQLASGGVLWWSPISAGWDGQWIQWFYYDPDGTGPVESVAFALWESTRAKFGSPNGQKYQPGRVTTFAEMSHISWGAYGSANPSWFSW